MSQTLEDILNGPALQPPAGEVPNFVNPRNDNTVASLTYVLCVLATTLGLIIRAYAKFSGGKTIELEDVLAFIGLGTFYGSVWCGFHIMSTNGAFVHQWNIRVKDSVGIFYIHHIGYNLCATTLGIGKAIILIEWNRIFVTRGTRNTFYYMCKILLTFSTLNHIAFIVAENMSCFPYQKIWDPTVVEGYCINPRIYQVPGVIIPPVYDAIILILPQRAIWNLKMSTKNKIGVSILFLVGLLGLGASIARADTMFDFLESKDKTYTISGVYLWTLAEMTCYYLAFCAPWAPRAIANRGMIYRAFNPLLSHIGLPQKLEAAAATHSWPSKPTPAATNCWDTGRIYQRIRDPAMALAKLPSNTSTNNQEEGAAVPNGGILMTTEITIAMDHVEEDVGLDYPWSTGRRIRRGKANRG